LNPKPQQVIQGIIRLGL